MTGDLSPSVGDVGRHSHLSIGRYHQHSVDQLDESVCVLEFFKATYPNGPTFKREEDEWRSYIGRFGITGGPEAAGVRCGASILVYIIGATRAQTRGLRHHG